jgi:hypothetical protein
LRPPPADRLILHPRLSARGDDRCTGDHGVCRIRDSARDGSMVALGKHAQCEQKATSNNTHNLPPARRIVLASWPVSTIHPIASTGAVLFEASRVCERFPRPYAREGRKLAKPLRSSLAKRFQRAHRCCRMAAFWRLGAPIPDYGPQTGIFRETGEFIVLAESIPIERALPIPAVDSELQDRR